MNNQLFKGPTLTESLLTIIENDTCSEMQSVLNHITNNNIQIGDVFDFRATYILLNK